MAEQRRTSRSILASLGLATALLGLLDLSPRAAEFGCRLVPNDRGLAEKTLQCGDSLTIRPAAGAKYHVIPKARQPLPAGVRLDDGAILIEFHPTPAEPNFEILTPLAIAAVRGTKWAMEVVKAKTSTLVLAGSVAVTSRRLNEYVVLGPGEGVDISVGDTTLVQKRWGEPRVRALMSRFGE